MSAANGVDAPSDEAIEKYLSKFNYGKALVAFQAEREARRSGQPSASTSNTTTLNDFAKANAPTGSKKDEGKLAEWRVKVDPTGWVEGLRGLADFVHNVSRLADLLRWVGSAWAVPRHPSARAVAHRPAHLRTYLPRPRQGHPCRHCEEAIGGVRRPRRSPATRH